MVEIEAQINETVQAPYNVSREQNQLSKVGTCVLTCVSTHVRMTEVSASRKQKGQLNEAFFVAKKRLTSCEVRTDVLVIEPKTLHAAGTSTASAIDDNLKLF
jgi:hypothetical protein